MTNVPKIVVSRLAAGSMQAVQPDAHPSANLLSAFAEQALGNADRLQVLEHLTQCTECREIVWVAAPPVEAATVVPAKVSAPWLSWPILRWGAVAACVVVVGAAVTLHKWETHPAQFAVEKSAPAISKPAAKSSQAPTTAPELDSAHTARDAEPAAPAANALAKRVPSDLKTATMARLQAQTAAPQAEPTPGSDQPDDLMATNELDSLVPGRAKDAVEEAQTPGNALSVTGAAAASESAPIKAKALIAATSRATPRWTLTADGTLQRSLDLGRTWEPITVAPGATLRALAANDLDIWVGGIAGTLYHSADAGQHWTQVQPASDGQQLTSDVIGVEFADVDHGRLRTSSGEVWTTKDAGSTWEKQ